ncbi:LysR family transcriptional regulator [Novosphingobium sp. BW1]|uniref:LysR family transcriptional regulator n=1 Tax=Novosphingobium sp. BW1 TaxID=2592621 RepID=UPI0013969A73|nr:LysR family transcriptional regulator [Novosphingobium sp. BW1]
MDTRKFDYFISVAETGSFSQAAVSLRLSQPLLSRQVRNLEEELGLPLFYRNGRGATLTEAGRCLLKNARNVREAIDATYSELSQLRNLLAGTAAIGMPTSVGRALSVPLAQHFSSELPNVKLHLVEGLSSDIAERVQQGRLDVAILYSPIRSQNMLCDPVVEEQLVLVSKRGRGPAGPVSFEDVTQLPLIMTGPHQQLRRDLEKAARAREAELQIAVEIDALGSILELVEEGLGHAILPPAALLRDEGMERFDVVRIDSGLVRRTLYVATGPQRSDAVPSHKLASLVKEKLLGLTGRNTWQIVESRSV